MCKRVHELTSSVLVAKVSFVGRARPEAQRPGSQPAGCGDVTVTRDEDSGSVGRGSRGTATGATDCRRLRRLDGADCPPLTPRA